MSLGGLTHALTPLAAASPLIHIFDAPARFLGALWLPYRRDRGETEAAVQAAGPVDAVFGHADVVSSHHQPPCYQGSTVPLQPGSCCSCSSSSKAFRSGFCLLSTLQEWFDFRLVLSILPSARATYPCVSGQ